MERLRLNERWLPVPGFEEYEVSDLGRVRSLDRIVLYSDGRKRFFAGQLLKQDDANANGYLRVVLYNAEGKRCAEVHRLVLETFVGPCPDGLQACHNDDVKDHNWLDNLRWDTASNNHVDRVLHGRHPSMKLTPDKVRELRRRRSEGAIVLALEVGTTPQAIHNLWNGRSWRHVL